MLTLARFDVNFDIHIDTDSDVNMDLDVNTHDVRIDVNSKVDVDVDIASISAFNDGAARSHNRGQTTRVQQRPTTNPLHPVEPQILKQEDVGGGAAAPCGRLDHRTRLLLHSSG